MAFTQFEKNINTICLQWCIVAVAVVSFWLVGQHQGYAQENEDQLKVGIPFQKMSETYMESVGRPWWTVVLVLPPESYSKENLEKIFQHYKEKYPNKKQALTVDVFAGVESYNRYRENPPFFGTVFSDKPPEPETKENWKRHHASFLRACDNEFYSYSPDLENPSKIERVLLKGRWTAGPELSECK